MAQFASAAFTGTAGTELTAADANWTRHASSTTGCNLVLTDANAVRTDGSNGAAVYYHSGVPASADYSANVDITKLSALNTAAGPTVRHNASATTFYLARYDVSDDTWRMYKAVGGTFTQLGSSVTASFSNGQTKNLKIEAIGTAIKAYADGAGTATIDVTDSSITATDKAGLRCGFGAAPVATNSTGLHLDNFSGDDAGSGVTGAIAATLAGVTSSVAGTTTAAGTIAVTLAGATSDISGTAGSSGPTGTIAVTLAGVTSAIAGSPVVTGAIAATLAGVSAVIAGTTTVVGTIAVALADVVGALTDFLAAVGGGNWPAWMRRRRDR